MKEKIHTKVLIIGSGPAGYSAAIYAARAALEPILVTGIQPGGQLTVTTDVENYPGFAEVIQGPWLMEQMHAQAKHVGTQIVTDHISKVDFSKRPFVCTGDSGTEYIGETVIICTGAQAKWLGIPTEKKFQGFGVSGCATCDGFFYRNKKVMVIGGGNTAVEEALYLTNHASHVTVVHRRDTFRAEKILQSRLFENPKISVIWDSALEEVLGSENPLSVTGARLKNLKTNALTDVAVDGIFVAIGHSPNTALFKGLLDMDEEGYIKTIPGTTNTNIPGVFAAGDVQDKLYRQAVTAAGTGCIGALQAGKFLVEHK
jgi:thioredoxin reductase (NADPH)